MKKIIQYFKKNISHKISFWKIENLKKIFQKYGLTFLTIVIIVEIVEHVGGFLLIRWLGLNVNDYFHALLPAPFLFCFHWLTSPIIFFIYLKFIKGKENVK